MSRELVGQYEIQDIDQQIDRILRDLGYPEPPLNLALVRDLLNMDRRYYSKQNPSFLEDLTHKFTVGAKQLMARPGLVLDVVRKAKLSAFYLPDTKRILIDDDVPKAKHRWIEAHEICHGVIEWHGEFCFGDNRYTVNPECDVALEAEANYGGGRLLFLGDRFTEQVRSTELSFENIRRLSKEYGNTLTSTLWRAVEEQSPDVPVFGMVSIHPRHPSIGRELDGELRFIRSQRFQQQFGNVMPETAYALLEKHASWSKGGPVVDTQDTLIDVDGRTFEFRIASFSNHHSLLTFGVCQEERAVAVAV